MVLAAVQRSGGALKHASGELQADKAVVLAAVRASSTAFRYGQTPKTSTAITSARISRKSPKSR